MTAPGHELEAHAISEHGEAARGEIETMAVNAGDALALGGFAERQAGLSLELRGGLVEVALAQGCEQATGEGDAFPIPRREAFGDEMVGSAFQCISHLAAEAAVRQRSAILRERQSVDPGRAARADLCLD